MKIAKILDKYTYVIDGGTYDKVKKGQKCYIYIKGESIDDPDTGDSLGNLEIPKLYCTVTHVQDNISVIQSDNAPTKMFNYTIKLNYDYFDNILTDEMREIKIGDYVKVIND